MQPLTKFLWYSKINNNFLWRTLLPASTIQRKNSERNGGPSRYYTTTDHNLQVTSCVQGDCMHLCIHETLGCPTWSLLRIPPRSDIHTSTCSTSCLFPLVIFFSLLLTSYLKGYLVPITLYTLLASIL